MHVFFLIGWLCLCYTLAVPHLPVSSVDDILTRFRNAYSYYEKTLGKDFLAKRGFNTVPYPKRTITDGQNFDFIIVGAGSSGSVIANRLSENPKWKVLLIETGGEPDVLTNVPSTSFLFKSTDMTKKIKSEPEIHTSNTPTLTFLTGRCLGGSSNINNMLADRGHQAEYDLLAAMGNTGWNFNEILQYFKASETANVENKNQQRGNDGPISIETKTERTKLADIFVKAAVSLGYHYGNRNSGHGTVSYPEKMTLNGLRFSADKAYLQPIKDRPNLTILTNHFINKINFDKDVKPKATGVTITNLLTKTNLVIKADKEVILCAGVFGNPKLLMHSGVGPDSLHYYDIPMVKNVPVGQTFYDQITVPTILFKTNTNNTIDAKEMVNPNNLEQLITTGCGPLSDSLALDGIVHCRSADFTGPQPLTDLQLRLYATNLYQPWPVFEKVHELGPSKFREVFEQVKGIDNMFTMEVTLVLPESRGHVDIASSNVYDPLKVTTNLFQAYSDKQRCLQGIRELQKIAATPIFKKIGAEQVFVKLNACNGVEVDSDEYWICIIENMQIPTNSGGGTCRMGPDNDPLAVVDPNLRVRGVQSLRVVGKSVFPNPISAIGNLPNFMIAEYAAYKIIKAWR